MFPFEHRLTEEEKNELISAHKTLEEGYVILYLEAEFQKRGYSVTRNQPMNTFTLVGGKQKTFDMLLNHHERKELRFVDVDMGHMSEDDFHNWLDKTYALTSNIFLATKDESTLYKSTKKHTFTWLRNRFGGIEGAKGLVKIYFTTLEWLIVGEKEWEEVDI